MIRGRGINLYSILLKENVQAIVEDYFNDRMNVCIILYNLASLIKRSQLQLSLENYYLVYEYT